MNPYHNEDAVMLRRHVVADILSARNAHRTAQQLQRKGYPVEFVQQARAVRDSSLRAARHDLGLYRAAQQLEASAGRIEVKP